MCQGQSALDARKSVALVLLVNVQGNGLVLSTQVPVLGLISSNLGKLIVGGILSARTVSAAAGDLYAIDGFQSTIFKYTPGGTRSTFATGLQSPAIIA